MLSLSMAPIDKINTTREHHRFVLLDSVVEIFKSMLYNEFRQSETVSHAYIDALSFERNTTSLSAKCAAEEFQELLT
jgi:hypothetical protein